VARRLPSGPARNRLDEEVELVQIAESEIHKRRLELSKDHNGTQEEREAVVNALNGLRVLRMDAATWRERQNLK
jgi:seryl-tRNA(Sec) selenium transferase